ncbi:MAG: hypothetical protein K2Q18_10240 [Bdellovibrionales bacterium]|nr:hypothetical protein [Bdellovibrionales bacterium]
MVIIVWSITIIFLALSFLKDKNRTFIALSISLKSFKNLVPGLLGMIVIVGLILALIPTEVLTTIFTYKGLMGFVIVSVIGAIVTIPAPIAFPLAGSLLKLGASYATLATFITTLTMVGLVTAPLEISYFGKRFTIMRQSLSFVAAIIIGLILGMFV